LLDIYLNREGVKFEQRFQRTASDLLDSLRAVAATVEDMSGNLEYRVSQLHDAAWEAADEAQESKSVAHRLTDDLERLERIALDEAAHTPLALFSRLQGMRRAVWSKFSEDGAFRPTKNTDRLMERLESQLEQPIDPNDWLTNQNELYFWKGVLKRRGDKGTMGSWRREITARDQLTVATTLRLRDEISRLRAEAGDERKAKR
jgi:hypothetical protein